MSRKLLIVLLCALMISGGASYIVFRLASGMQHGARTTAPVQLVAAARDLEVGTLLREADLKNVGH